MNNINIQVMSRMAASEYCLRRHSEESAIISISTPYIDYKYNRIFGDQQNNVTDILRLSFMDADTPGKDDVYGTFTTEQDLMSNEDAKDVVAFVEKNKAKKIIVHCDGGISRSSAVVAAILKFYTGDDSSIFDNHRYSPNMWVYRKVLEELYENGRTNEN